MCWVKCSRMGMLGFSSLQPTLQSHRKTMKLLGPDDVKEEGELFFLKKASKRVHSNKGIFRRLIDIIDNHEFESKMFIEGSIPRKEGRGNRRAGRGVVP